MFVPRGAGGWEVGMKVQPVPFLARAVFLPCRWPPPCCVLTGQGEREQVLRSSPPVRALNPVMTVNPSLTISSNPNYLPKAPLKYQQVLVREFNR